MSYKKNPYTVDPFESEPLAYPIEPSAPQESTLLESPPPLYEPVGSTLQINAQRKMLILMRI